jgi:hypothetical protein
MIDNSMEFENEEKIRLKVKLSHWVAFLCPKRNCPKAHLRIQPNVSDKFRLQSGICPNVSDKVRFIRKMKMIIFCSLPATKDGFLKCCCCFFALFLIHLSLQRLHVFPFGQSIFTVKTPLEEVKQSETHHVDGTFKSCTKH